MKMSLYSSIPNIISLVRLLSAPVLIVLFMDQQYAFAFWLFITASLGDALDGYLARRLNSKTKIGQILDPLADKVLLVSVFYLLGAYGLLPLWLIFLSISRDLGIVLAIGVLQIQKKRYRAPPTFISKLNTAFQMFLIVWTLGNQAYTLPFDFLKESLIYIVLFTTLLSWYDYVGVFRKLLKGAPRKNGK